MSAARITSIASIALAALAAAAAGAWLGMRTSAPREQLAPTIGGYVLDEPRALPDFALVDGEGRPFGANDFLGRWSFLYFGYTYCPDVCPLALVQLAELKKILAETEPGVATAYYLVSVDPARDTPERLRDYVTYFDPGFRGLTGPLAEIDKLAKAASVVYVIPEAEEGESYLVGHSSTITLIDPEGRIHAIFTSPFEAETLAADFSTILDRRR
ncbi:MAG TPA: SCO family protein [Gammaproteobacteria bacterium]